MATGTRSLGVSAVVGICLVGILVTGGVVAGAAVVDGGSTSADVDWGSYAGDAANTGHGEPPLSVDEAPDTRRLLGLDGDIAGSPVVVDGSLYVAADDRVAAHHVPTGTDRWEVLPGADVLASPAVANDQVVVVDETGTVTALAAADGATEWQTELDGPAVAAPTIRNGTVYLGTNAGRFDDVSTDIAEIRLKLDATDTELYEFRLRRTDDGQEETCVYDDENDGSIHVDRRASSADPELLIETGRQSDLTHEATLDTSGGSIDFRVFVDRSMVECYVNERQSVTTRAYPERSDADGFRVFYAGDVTVESLQVWELRGISDRL